MNVAKQGNDLATVNEITNLGVSERACSVRFINERGHDHHTFRYLPLNQTLIIPVSSTCNQNKDELFDG